MLDAYAQSLLDDPAKRQRELKNVAHQCTDGSRFAREVKHSLIAVTCRGGKAAIPYSAYLGSQYPNSGGPYIIAMTYDVLVVEVPAKLRGKGIFTEWFEYYVRRARECADGIRFHNVINLWLQDKLLKYDFIMDGEYFVNFDLVPLLDKLWSNENGQV